MARRRRRPSAQTRTVLDALATGSEQWRFGYELSRETGLASGTLYPLLGRLADRGYLESRWEQTVPGRPPRHLYRLSAQGRRDLVELEASAERRVLPEAVGQSA